MLIDCDNISWQLAKSVIAEAAKHGTLSVKRAYGDWSSDYLRNWKPESRAMRSSRFSSPPTRSGVPASSGVRVG